MHMLTWQPTDNIGYQQSVCMVSTISQLPIYSVIYSYIGYQVTV